MSTLTTQSTYYPIATTLFGTSSPVSGSAPSDPADGLATNGLAEVSVYLSVANSITLSGAGSLLAWEFTPFLNRWARVPGMDIPITTSGVRDLMAGVILPASFLNAQRISTRVQYVPSGVTFSSGSGGVTVTLVGTKAVMAGTGIGG